MENNSVTIDIFGLDNAAIQNQRTIIESLNNSKINCYRNNDYIDHPEQLSVKSDVIIINLSTQGIDELRCIENSTHTNQNIIIIGDKRNNQLLSLAISARVSEFIDKDNYQENLPPIVTKLLHKVSSENHSNKSKLIVVMNAKGGSGASIIASNIAYSLSQQKNANTALIDLDLQFGSIGLNFDCAPKYTVDKVLNNINNTDYMELEAHMVSYANSLKLLLPPQEEIILNDEINPASIKSLLYLMQRNYSEVIIDLPRLIDPLSINVLEQADHIVIAVQQSLAHYRDGRRLVNILNKDLDVGLEKISVIINRYDKKNSLSRADMINIVNHQHVFMIANDFKNVTMSSNLGNPITRSKPKSKVAKDIHSIASYLADSNNNKRFERPNIMKRMFG